MIALAEHYSVNLRQRLLPFVAVNFGDRFISLRGFPVMQGFGYKKTLEMFTLACLAIAMKASNLDFDFANFIGLHLVGNEEVEIVRGLKKTIKGCLKGRLGLKESLTPTFAFEPIPVLANFAIIDNEQPLPLGAVNYIVAGMHKDIRFTEYKYSTVAASAILATTNALYPLLHPLIEKRLLKSDLIDKDEVTQCFNDLRDHVVISHILGPQRVFGAIPEQDKGKQPLINVDWRAQQQQWELVDMDLTWFEP